MRCAKAAFSAAIWLSALSYTAAQSPRSTTVELTTRPIREGRFKPGWGVSTDIPKTAWVGKLGQRYYAFFDLNDDGELTTDGDDGFGVTGFPFVVKLPPRLLLPVGQYDVSFDLPRLVLKRQALKVSPTLIRDASVLTDMRMSAGLSPLTIDEELSRHCELHCAYLRRNPVPRGSNPHNETPGRPGYTPEGAEAGHGSCIHQGRSDYAKAVQGFYQTAWHSMPILHPNASEAGIASKEGTAMLYVARPSITIREPFVHPVAGAVDVPRAFSELGEMPNPVPGTDCGKGCGFPICIILTAELRGQALKEAAVRPVQIRGGNTKVGRPVKGTISCPKKPATPDWPSNSGLALFIPSEPLAPRTTYQARFVFEGGQEHEWSFRTGTK